jgi:hypothetical protein
MNMKENFKIMKLMVLEFSNGVMGRYMKGK